MNKISDEVKWLICEGIIIFLLLVIIALLVMDFDCPKEDEVTESAEISMVVDESLQEEEGIEDTEIIVDVKGAVVAPGVYKINKDSRINDAIELAGGLKSNASTKYLNLSKKITDEMVIYVYTTTQIKNMSVTSVVKEECSCPTEDISKCAGSSVISVGETSDNTNSTNSNSDSTSNKISINKGSKEELMTLSGIGESKAEAIIEYRNANNGFKSLEDIMNVSGIGESAYNKIKDNITL